MRAYIWIAGGEHQRRLLKYLLEENNHNPLERPVYNDSHTLTVTMNLALQQIIDFVSVVSAHWKRHECPPLNRLGWKKWNSFYQWLACSGIEYSWKYNLVFVAEIYSYV